MQRRKYRVLCAVLLFTPLPMLQGFEFRGNFSSSSHEARIMSQIELLDYRVPADSVRELKIGFSEFKADRTGDRLSASLPLQILRGLPDDLPSRSLSDQEMRSIQERLLRAQRTSAIRDVNTSRNRLDDLLFSLDSAQERQRKRIDLQAELSRRRERLALIETLPLSMVSVHDTKRLLLTTPRDRQLYPQYSTSMPADLNILVSGEVSRIGDYVEILITLRFSEPDDLSMEIFRDVVHQDDVFNLVPEMQYALIQSLARRDIAMVRFTSAPYASSAVYIGENRTAVDISQALFIEPGFLPVLLVTPYGSVQRSNVELVPGIQEVELDFPVLPEGSIALNVEPYAVSVYRGGEFIGRTPMELPVFDTSQIISLHREGYRERLFLLPGGSDQVQKNLLRDTFSLNEELRSSRDDFYDALGLFALSVPLWVLSTASMNHIVALINDAEAANALDSSMFFWGNAIFYSNITFRSVSIALGINAGFRLARYIRFAQAEHTGRY
ncbi:hypothetical protein [Spirochaeta dissipatitropha]